MKTPKATGVIATFASAVLSLLLPASAMSAEVPNDPRRDDPILRFRWGAGDPGLVVPQLRIELSRHVAGDMPAALAQARAYVLGIVTPADASVLGDTGEVSVQATIVPALAEGDGVELLVDGVPAGPPTQVLDFALNGIARGEHVLQGRVIDATGNVASVSPATVFYVGQAAMDFPNLRGGPGRDY